jgi:diguanylate cyclase (GGDEF)-like protein
MLARVSVSAGDPVANELSQPVRDLGGGTLRVEVSGDAERRALGNARRNLLAAGEVVLLLAFAASLLLTRALVRPIQRIGEASRRIQAGDLGVRLRSGRRDELGEVARAFDAMLDRVQGALEGLARAQQLAELGSWTLELSSGEVNCSHELRRICDLDAGTSLDLAQLLERCVHPEDRPRVREAIERCIRNGEPVRLDHRTLPLGGAPRVVHTQAERIPQGGDPERIEGTLQDVTERRLIEEQLRYLAEHDGLTGLANRRLLEEQLSVMLSEARLQPRGLAVLVLGLDDFKLINDTLGPSWGDRALEQVAQRLAQVATPHLALARIGGDEFAVLAGDISDASGAARIARRMLRVLRAPLVLDGHELVVGASVGIALWPNDGVDPESLLRNAGAALHVAKQHGRGSHQFYDESLNALAFKRLALEKGLRRALENGEFELHYQPVLDLANGRVAGVEALLRWRDPENGLIPPAGFIPIAEETGLIRELGLWILRTAVAQVRSWKGTPLAGLSVAINVSAAQLDGLELAAHLEQALAEAGIEPSSLMLEITESLLPSDPLAASALLERIAALGVRIALDDFGIGFSSLSALRQLPVHTVKLDRSFASSLGTDPRSTQLMGAIVAMAHVLSLSVTVEGIETEDQLEIVREFGCDAIQGYLVSAAVEARDLPRVVVEIEGEDEKRLASEPSA